MPRTARNRISATPLPTVASSTHPTPQMQSPYSLPSSPESVLYSESSSSEAPRTSGSGTGSDPAPPVAESWELDSIRDSSVSPSPSAPSSSPAIPQDHPTTVIDLTDASEIGLPSGPRNSSPRALARTLRLRSGTVHIPGLPPPVPWPSVIPPPRLRRTSSHHPMAFPPDRSPNMPVDYNPYRQTRHQQPPEPRYDTVSPSQLLKRRASESAESISSASTSASPEPVEQESNSGGSNKKRKVQVQVEAIDLIDVDDDEGVQAMIQRQRHEMLKQQAKEGEKRRRIADYQCVICLDDPTDLSVTTCGHLFCNQCLIHSIRHLVPAAKVGKCPSCRGKINVKDIVPLELKLVRRPKGKGKGKERADD